MATVLAIQFSLVFDCYSESFQFFDKDGMAIVPFFEDSTK
jgi:hypothetical protein